MKTESFLSEFLWLCFYQWAYLLALWLACFGFACFKVNDKVLKIIRFILRKRPLKRASKYHILKSAALTDFVIDFGLLDSQGIVYLCSAPLNRQGNTCIKLSYLRQIKHSFIQKSRKYIGKDISTTSLLYLV